MLDRVITALFVAILGTAWFLTRHCEIPCSFRIIVYDIFGKQAHIEGLRTRFDTHVAAVSFAKHYQALFPHYTFALESGLPKIRRRVLMVRAQK